MSSVNVSDADFENEVLKSDEPVMVDFWAEWCGPCKMIAPVLEDIAGEYADRVKVVKMDVESSPQTPMKYGVRNIPTLMLFKGGSVEATKVGMVSKGQLGDFIDNAV